MCQQALSADCLGLGLMRRSKCLPQPRTHAFHRYALLGWLDCPEILLPAAGKSLSAWRGLYQLSKLRQGIDPSRHQQYFDLTHRQFRRRWVARHPGVPVQQTFISLLNPGKWHGLALHVHTPAHPARIYAPSHAWHHACSQYLHVYTFCIRMSCIAAR